MQYFGCSHILFKVSQSLSLGDYYRQVPPRNSSQFFRRNKAYNNISDLMSRFVFGYDVERLKYLKTKICQSRQLNKGREYIFFEQQNCMMQLALPGIQSNKFLDINAIEHSFSEEVSNIGFNVTLLHNHPHALPNHCLVYSKDFKKATYKPKENLQSWPCSWYLDGEAVIPYQFSENYLSYDETEVRSNLETLGKMGLKHYGTTVRTVSKVLEYQTKHGHVYVPISQQLKGKEGISETATNGKRMADSCQTFCQKKKHIRESMTPQIVTEAPIVIRSTKYSLTQLQKIIYLF